MAGRKSKSQRRRELLLAARDTFVEKGFQAATVDDIVAKAGVARGTFYLYFDDKRDVFEALVDDFLMRITACVKSIELDPDAPPPVEQLRANIRRVVELALGEPTIVKLALFDATGLDPDLDEKLHGYYEGLRLLIAESLEQGQELGMVREGDRRLMVAIGLGGLKEVLVDAVGAQIDADAGQITDEIMRFLAGGLLA
ncbi:MAG TPA: TetR/AcrR family transcriptional regulator [Sandaracinaceae bacterium LLY-WYZ-13_1]|nr:TetR/AcrR family transcriptional regulator [Sandaracinaceae bacterium LLY-WYZ-13_1]